MDGLDPAIVQEIAQPRSNADAYDFVREFARKYTWLAAVMRRKMPYHGKPASVAHLRYHSIEEFIMFNSRLVEGDPMATPMPTGIKGNCFGNAFLIALQNPEYRYTEGWATMKQSIHTHHAWLTGPDGSIHDPTWKAIGEENGMASLPTVYHGVSIDAAAHHGWFLAEGSPNLLYRDELQMDGVLEKGMAYFDQFRFDNQTSSDLLAGTIKMIEEHGLWQLEPESNIFVHSRTGQRWCGQTRKFI